jgi:hypothetical protein
MLVQEISSVLAVVVVTARLIGSVALPTARNSPRQGPQRR